MPVCVGVGYAHRKYARAIHPLTHLYLTKPTSVMVLPHSFLGGSAGDLEKNFISGITETSSSFRRVHLVRGDGHLPIPAVVSIDTQNMLMEGNVRVVVREERTEPYQWEEARAPRVIIVLE